MIHAAAPSSTAAHSSSIGTGGPGVTSRLLAIATATGRPGHEPHGAADEPGVTDQGGRSPGQLDRVAAKAERLRRVRPGRDELGHHVGPPSWHARVRGLGEGEREADHVGQVGEQPGVAGDAAVGVERVAVVDGAEHRPVPPAGEVVGSATARGAEPVASIARSTSSPNALIAASGPAGVANVVRTSPSGSVTSWATARSSGSPATAATMRPSCTNPRSE